MRKALFVATVAFVALVAGPVLAQSTQDPLDPSFWENLFGVTGMVAAVLVLLWRSMDAIARLIPDSQTGPLGFLRWLLRVLSVTPADYTN